MNITIVITSAFISSTIASLVTYFLRLYFDKRLEFNFNKKLEELKSELTLQTDLAHQYSTRRLDIYPKIAELVYRLRNSLRDVCDQEDLQLSQTLVFIGYLDEFIEEIYHSRLDLERDQVFMVLHSYKDIASDAKNRLLDLLKLKVEDNNIDLRKNIQKKYQQIDRQHKKIIKTLTTLTE